MTIPLVDIQTVEYICTVSTVYVHFYTVYIHLYRVSQEECEILRESVPYVKLY